VPAKKRLDGHPESPGERMKPAPRKLIADHKGNHEELRTIWAPSNDVQSVLARLFSSAHKVPACVNEQRVSAIRKYPVMNLIA